MKLIIFDLDDTLYCEMSYVREGYKAAALYIATHYGISAKKVFRMCMDIVKSDPHGATFDTLLRHLRINDRSLTERLVEVYRSHKLRIRLHRGARKLLEQLHRHSALALITNGTSPVQKRKIAHLKLEPFFDEIICTLDHDSTWVKPNTGAFEALLKRFEILPNNAIYIGNDPEKDFKNVKKLGIRTVRLMQGRYKYRNVSDESNADYTIRNLIELPSLLNSLAL